LKRFSALTRSPSTGLKPGVNEKVLRQGEETL